MISDDDELVRFPVFVPTALKTTGAYCGDAELLNCSLDHRYSLAWGHGGQQIALVDELDLVVVVTADPLYGQDGDESWRLEKANLNLAADFIASLPSW